MIKSPTFKLQPAWQPLGTRSCKKLQAVLQAQAACIKAKHFGQLQELRRLRAKSPVFRSLKQLRFPAGCRVFRVCKSFRNSRSLLTDDVFSWQSPGWQELTRGNRGGGKDEQRVAISVHLPAAKLTRTASRRAPYEVA